MNGKSIDSALHSVVHHIEWALSFKEHTLATILDFEGTYNNTKIDAVMAVLSRVNVNPFIRGWLRNMLSQRNIITILADTTRHARAKKWWMKFSKAIETRVITSGKYPETLANIMEGDLTAISIWAPKCGPNLNTNKTELVLYTRKRKVPNFRTPSQDKEIVCCYSYTGFLQL